jgi:hypothetical protein
LGVPVTLPRVRLGSRAYAQLIHASMISHHQAG